MRSGPSTTTGTPLYSSALCCSTCTCNCLNIRLSPVLLPHNPSHFVSWNGALPTSAGESMSANLCLGQHVLRGCPFRRHVRQRHHQPLVTPRAAIAAASAPRVAHQQIDQTVFNKVHSLIQQHGLDQDPGLVAQEAVLAYQFLQASGSLPSSIQDPSQLAQHAVELSDLLATGSTFRTLQMLKRHPSLLSISPHEVACKVLQLKMLMPAANIAELLYQKPTLLLVADLPGTLGPALNKLHALMPGIPVEKKLHEGGTVFWSFVSLLDNSSSRAAAASVGAAPEGHSL